MNTAPRGRAAPPGEGSGTAAAACQRPGCAGGYPTPRDGDAGGGEPYCSACGMAPAVSPHGVIGATATGRAAAGAGSGRSVTGGSGRGSPGGSVRGPGSGSARSQASQQSASQQSASGQSASGQSASGRLSRSLSGREGARPVAVRSSGTAPGTTARSRLGAGLVSVPEVPWADPATMVLRDPRVPERKRFCGSSGCGARVGRTRHGRPGRTEGFCTQCGKRYSFVPRLRPGDVVHGQYEIAGCLAHGGLGWIYLAVDHAVAGRWVVLKGLLDTGDEAAMDAAVAERRFLAEIEHANIVRIYNFVEHPDRRTGSMDGYIVMEYVGGRSLKDIANSRRTPEGRRDPLPVEQACAYGIGALEALGHLHGRNLLYCDFKVDNAIQQDDQLKLIDMGAVRRMDDDRSAVYGTIGYQAPEVPEVGPSVASDLYTVARALAVLTFDFTGYTTAYADSLPGPEDVEVFRRYESFHRFLVRATDPDPRRRFGSAQEMAEQLTGVLREVVALRTGRPQPTMSTLFGAELRVVDTEALPRVTGDTSVLGARRPLPRRRLLRRRGVPAAGQRAGTGPAAAALPPPGPGGGHSRSPVGGPGASTGAGSVGPALPGAGPAGQRAAYAPTGGPPATVPPPGHQRRGAEEHAPYGDRAGRVRQPGRPVEPAPPAPGHTPVPVPLRTRAAALALPAPLVDPADPCAGFLAGLAGSSPAEVGAALAHAPADSVELRLRELRARLELATPQDRERAAHALAELEARHPDDWRIVWYRGLTALAAGDRESAALAFDAVYAAFPGETAPKLALGVCAEVLGRSEDAAAYYRLVWATDTSYVSAAFGLARVRLATGDRRGAVEVLESVPETSSHHVAARIAAVRARLAGRDPREPLYEDLCAAGREVERLRAAGLDTTRHEELTTEVLGSALDWVLAARPVLDGRHVLPLLGAVPEEVRLREGLERSFRRLARLAHSGSERIELVERANRFRPRTWV